MIHVMSVGILNIRYYLNWLYFNMYILICIVFFIDNESSTYQSDVIPGEGLESQDHASPIF